ncbi:hypothetical protein DFH28DRAFT_882503 [Melampsora americana]|nr:hypothetical protein DFH28DRAFT_882503 [Melampsora americana]
MKTTNPTHHHHPHQTTSTSSSSTQIITEPNPSSSKPSNPIINQHLTFDSTSIPPIPIINDPHSLNLSRRTSTSSSLSSTSTWWRFWRNSSSSSSSSTSSNSIHRNYSEFTLMTPSSNPSSPKSIPIDFLTHHQTNPTLMINPTTISHQIPGYDSFTSATINPALQRLLAFWRDRNEANQNENDQNEVNQNERLSPFISLHPDPEELPSSNQRVIHHHRLRCLPKIKRQPLSPMHKLLFKESGRLYLLEDPNSFTSAPKLKKRSSWWLDVTNPNEQDMNQIGKIFGIHPLTIEDILQTDDREKSEMFDKLGYYLICFRGLDESNFQEEIEETEEEEEEMSEMMSGQEEVKSMNHASLLTMRSARNRKLRSRKKRLRVKDGAIGVGAVNMYLIVFGDGIISFHFEDLQKHIDRVKERIQSFSATSHYISPHWIAHGLMDSIIDSFFPILSYVENESDELDDYLSDPYQSKQTRLSTLDPTFNRFKMLDRITQNRKLVVMMTRLLNQKVQVVEGLRKRMGSDKESEIHLHFGDLQDHIMAIFQTLNFYDTLLSNAHLTYLGILRITLDRTKLSQDILIIRLYTLSLIAYPMLSVIGFHSMNINIPKNGDRDDHVRSDGSPSPYYVFGIVVVICSVVGLGMIILIRGIIRKSEIVYRRKVMDRFLKALS